MGRKEGSGGWVGWGGGGREIEREKGEGEAERDGERRGSNVD